MANSSSSNVSIIEFLKKATDDNRPSEYLKGFYSQQIVDYRKFIVEQQQIADVVKKQIDVLKIIIEELKGEHKDPILDGGALMRLQNELSEEEVKFDDMVHWIKKAEMKIDEKRRMLGEDW